MRSEQQISPSVLLVLAEKFAEIKKKKKGILKMDFHLVSGRLDRGTLEVSSHFACVPSAEDQGAFQGWLRHNPAQISVPSLH